MQSPKRDGDQKDVMKNKRCVGRNSQLSCTWMSTLCAAAKKYTVITLVLLSAKAMICVQLKIHQSNRQHMSFVCNRDLISILSRVSSNDSTVSLLLSHSWTVKPHLCTPTTHCQPPRRLHWGPLFSVSPHTFQGEKPETPQASLLEWQSWRYV